MIITKFRAGDKVVCINKEANPDSSLVIGNVYIIEALMGDYTISLKDNICSGWTASQFELYTPSWDD